MFSQLVVLSIKIQAIKTTENDTIRIISWNIKMIPNLLLGMMA